MANSAPSAENFCAIVSSAQAQRRPNEGDMQEEEKKENDMKYVQEEDEVLGEESDSEFNRGKDTGIDCSRV